MLDRAMVAACRPLILETLGNFVLVVHLVDCHALIGEVQHTIVQICVGVSLCSHYFLNALVAPARPRVGREHHLCVLAEQVQC